MDQIDELAEKRWLSLPNHIRKQYESNVFCSKCLGETTIVDYHVSSDNYNIVLVGHCKTCNGKVARVID